MEASETKICVDGARVAAARPVVAAQRHVEAAEVERFEVEVDDEQVLLEGGRVGDELAFVVEDHAVAVEDELVLAADEVDVGRRRRRCREARVANMRCAEVALAVVVGRAADVDDDVGAGEA